MGSAAVSSCSHCEAVVSAHHTDYVTPPLACLAAGNSSCFSVRPRVTPRHSASPKVWGIPVSALTSPTVDWEGKSLSATQAWWACGQADQAASTSRSPCPDPTGHPNRSIQREPGTAADPGREGGQLHRAVNSLKQVLTPIGPQALRISMYRRKKGRPQNFSM